MRVTLFVAAAVAVAMLSSPDALRSALATSASALFEATPFLLAGVAVAHLVRCRHVTAYLGCGCGSGPSARSLPAAAAAWLVFGPLVAIARFVAAVVVARFTDAKTPHESPELLDELAAIVPAAAIAGAVTQFATLADARPLAPSMQIFGGALLGFATAPCGIGAIGVAGALHGRAPLAAAAFLCIAGIADLRTLVSCRTHRGQAHDVFAYVLLACALGIVGWRHGGALVHPAIAGALLACGAVALVLASIHRTRRNPCTRLAPALMLLGALVTAPPPAYRATETTLSDLFPGERLTFTGTLTRDANDAALVRYAIVCCRADAAPVAVRLAQRPPFPAGTWLRADGAIEIHAGAPRLVARSIERIAPPADPFIYR